jgi:UDP-glucose 4-epimerase
MGQGTDVQLVTGGAGFIGSHLVARLVERGDTVRVFDNFSSGKWENLADVRGDVEVVEGDLRDEAAVRRAVRGVDAIYHQAALRSVPRSVADPRSSLDVNIMGMLTLLQAACDAGCRRLVFASSSSVYGDTPALPKHEAMTPNPISPYAISKISGEQLCAVFTRLYGLETVALRYFNVFGPRQDPASEYAAVIPKFLDALTSGCTPVIYGDGRQSRDFTYVDNVVAANIAAAVAEGVAGQAFNIASGRAVTLLEVLEALAKLTGESPRKRHEPPRAGDVRDTLADLSAARAGLGYEVLVPFEAGLERTVAAAGRLLTHA